MSAEFAPVRGSTHGLSDVEEFLPRLGASGLFSQDKPVHVARAPGRLDVMGGIADYSGSLVLQLPLAEACLCAAQVRDDRRIVVVSAGDPALRSPRVELSLDDLAPGDEPREYATVRRLLSRDPRDHWVAYVAGAFVVLMRERGARFAAGATLLVHSDVPEGAGVSSSAALEVASMRAIAAAFDLSLDGTELALLCQLVENLVVGAPCGVMDQMTAAWGEPGRLLALRCQPCELEGQIALPDELAVFGIASGVRHSVGADVYGRVRAAAFMGYRILAVARGCRAEVTGNLARIEDPEWHGYLANCDPKEFEQRWSKELPDDMSGVEFLARYGASPDPVAQVRTNARYPIRMATAHPVHENARVERFRELLQGELTENARRELGELMFSSHQSYSSCGLGNPETDWLAERVSSEVAANSGLWGAKITGGGMGGTVAVLGDRDRAEAVVATIAAEYAARSGAAPSVFRDSSPGAMGFGVLELRKP